MSNNPQTDRRERYAAAIREADGWVLDDGQHVIDAVMAVADAELAARRAADLRDAEEICDEAGASYTAKALNEQADGAYSLMARFRRKAEEAEQTAAVLPAVPVPPKTHTTDRAAVYRELADQQTQLAVADDLARRRDAAAARRQLVKELRRLADEAQQQPDTETEAHPPSHRWSVETRDDDVTDQWAPGTPITDHDKAVERYEHVTKNWPTWKDGTPVERRLVRMTTTYTVERPVSGPGRVPDEGRES